MSHRITTEPPNGESKSELLDFSAPLFFRSGKTPLRMNYGLSISFRSYELSRESKGYTSRQCRGKEVDDSAMIRHCSFCS